MSDILFDANSVKCVTFDKFICFPINLFDCLLLDFRISWIGEVTVIVSQDCTDSERHILN